MPKETFFNLNEEKQEKVMRAAINEFILHGFEKANIGIIAKNAGVAKGSMYQYFENKRELFLFAVRWSLEFITKKYNNYIEFTNKEMNFFDYFYQNSKEIWVQLRDERDLVIFIQDVFLGKYPGVTDESIAYMMKVSDDYLIKLIQEGKDNGSIRKDIDNNLLSLFMTGASLKFKEYMMNKARAKGEDIMDEDFEAFENEIKTMMDLLKNGMGAK
ncbi:MAG: TetR/AcrR family transcriptional regulator [Bacillota bacterium]|nr:TetR/AcrR family transcriptional regulator [Bacillota bacterium]